MEARYQTQTVGSWDEYVALGYRQAGLALSRSSGRLDALDFHPEILNPPCLPGSRRNTFPLSPCQALTGQHWRGWRSCSTTEPQHGCWTGLAPRSWHSFSHSRIRSPRSRAQLRWSGLLTTDGSIEWPAVPSVGEFRTTPEGNSFTASPGRKDRSLKVLAYCVTGADYLFECPKPPWPTRQEDWHLPGRRPGDRAAGQLRALECRGGAGDLRSLRVVSQPRRGMVVAIAAAMQSGARWIRLDLQQDTRGARGR